MSMRTRAHILTIARVRTPKHTHTHTHTSSLEDSRYSFNALGCLGCDAQKEYVLAICLDQNQVSLAQPCWECLLCKLCSEDACSANPRLPPPPPSVDQTDVTAVFSSLCVDVNDVTAHLKASMAVLLHLKRNCNVTVTAHLKASMAALLHLKRNCNVTVTAQLMGLMAALLHLE